MKAQYSKRCNAVSFLTAFTTLATQILVFRIISAKLFNHYAFLVISLTMLGFALSGVILAFNGKFIKSPRRHIPIFTYLFVLTLITSAVLFYQLPINFQFVVDRISYIKSFLFFISLACLFVIPFIFCGLILGVLLAHPQLPTRKIYCFDLAGSALGALLIVFFISFLGVEKSLLILCCLLLLGINIILPAGTQKNRLRLRMALFLILVLYANDSKIFKMKPPAGTHLASLETEHYEWDPVARIEVSNIDLVKGSISDLDLSMIGTRLEFHGQIKKFLTQNNNAGTWAFYYDGNIDSLKGIEETLYYGAYKATSVASPQVLVIGVGAGMDILTALYSHAAKITGVEINGAIHKILKKTYKDYFKHWVDDPRVHLAHDEGRHYLSRTHDLYDIIQLTGVDSYSGTMAAANIFAENYLYTKEAVKLYYEKLTQEGLINIIRLEYPDTPREMLRMLTTAVAALREIGIQEPSRHIVMLSNVWLNGASLLIKKKPFKEEDTQRLRDWAAQSPYFIYSTSADLPLTVSRFYQTFLELNDKSQEEIFIRLYPWNIRPTEDDQPFFFRYTKWKHLFQKGTPKLELNIILLLSVLTTLSWIFIRLPLKYLSNSCAPLRNKHRYALIFSCLGLGYMFIEIAFMQKLGLFLGHPNYAVSIVLFSLLFSTGAGSMFSKNIIRKLINIRYTVYCLTIVILMEYVFVLPNLNLWIGMNIFLKGGMAFLLLLPIGLLLGIYLPETLDHLKKTSAGYVPWGWGINGFFSVISPVAAIAISVTFGINFLLLCSVPLYLMVGYFLSKVEEEIPKQIISTHHTP